MQSSSSIRLGITFKGSSECWKDASIFQIALHGSQGEIPAYQEELQLQAGRLSWVVEGRFVDKIEVHLASVGVIRLSAKIAEYFARPGLIGATKGVQTYDFPIAIEGFPIFEAGKDYLIRIQNVGERILKASFAEDV